jgi:hypothetical protein
MGKSGTLRKRRKAVRKLKERVRKNSRKQRARRRFLMMKATKTAGRRIAMMSDLFVRSS